MEAVTQIIPQRRSVRTYNGETLAQDVQEKLLTFMENVPNPYGMPVSFRLLNAKEKGLVCPVVTGTDLYVGGKMQKGPYANVAFGYSFEAMVLYAWSLGVGTVWLGGTMNRSAFEQAMGLEEGEMMPCASALGYIAPKMSLRESMMRKGVKADMRMPFEELFFKGDFNTPLAKKQAGIVGQALEMVRLAPSAVNKQPWRVVVKEKDVHFYLKRSKGFSHDGHLDMQMVDMGIALCHFELTAKELGLSVAFVREDPNLSLDMEYIGTYRMTA
ncbi:MAG: nitroreductase family protein [Clostridia bacterium]|nr:nitroreductase family protein [Clostridia bacterium]